MPPYSVYSPLPTMLLYYRALPYVGPRTAPGTYDPVTLYMR